MLRFPRDVGQHWQEMIATTAAAPSSGSYSDGERSLASGSPPGTALLPLGGVAPEPW